MQPIIGKKPEEYREDRSSDGKSTVLTRQWTFIKVDSIRDVKFINVKIRSKNFMVVKIGKFVDLILNFDSHNKMNLLINFVGNGVGDMPKELCWWLKNGAEIGTIKDFADNLTLELPPSIDSINEIKNILREMEMLRKKSDEQGNRIDGSPSPYVGGVTALAQGNFDTKILILN